MKCRPPHFEIIESQRQNPEKSFKSCKILKSTARNRSYNHNGSTHSCPPSQAAVSGPHEVTSQIGIGGMGEAHRATDANLKRAVAIKVLPSDVSEHPERLARFQREAKGLATPLFQGESR